LIAGLIEARVFGRGEPRIHPSVEVVGRHPGVGERKDVHQAIVMLAFQKRGDVPRKRGLRHGICNKLWFVRDASFEFVKRERRLKRYRSFGPERAVVVKDGRDR